ncbi:MAG: hypothetical protein JWO32_2898 [Bacteroidetes bacterium]|nr:hypothetical protein [Bacteroidota bacterium]
MGSNLITKYDSSGTLAWSAYAQGVFRNLIRVGKGIVARGNFSTNQYQKTAMVHLDLNGNILWNKTFDISVETGLFESPLFSGKDNIIYITGTRAVGNSYQNQLIKINMQGDSIGGFNIENYTQALTVADNSKIYVLGHVYPSASTQTYYIAAYNQTGFKTSEDTLSGLCLSFTDIQSLNNKVFISGCYYKNAELAGNTYTTNLNLLFVAELHNNGTVSIIKQTISNGGWVAPQEFVLTPNGSVFLAGTFTGRHLFGSDTIKTVDSGGDMFVAKLESVIDVGVREETTGSLFTEVFPVPSSGFITIKGSTGAKSLVFINIVNSIGQLLSSEQFISNSDFDKQIDLYYLQKGMYFIEVITPEERIFKKILLN